MRNIVDVAGGKPIAVFDFIFGLSFIFAYRLVSGYPMKVIKVKQN
jgi:hypothetical protein